ncbi:MAG: DUF882 domain-containing protein [Candidatus Competibacteraceae bacterium]|nr:DUF882 domain-containing protein [Candidatus Competibacteraceae bacterium]
MTAAGVVSSPALAKVAGIQERERLLSIYNAHTGESLKLVYWAPGDGYLNQSLKEISWVLRDRRTDEVELIDPALLDQLYALRLQLNSRETFHILSGYRSPRTNEMLRRNGHGVAKNSFHMQGRAVDIRLPGRDVSQVRRAALSLQAGGVGSYRSFVHIDTGPVRSW